MKKFQPEAHIADLNALRIVSSLSQESIRKEFKKIGLPSNQVFWSVFKHSGILVEVGKDKYIFQSQPIYVEKLAHIYKVYQSKLDSYKNKKQDPFKNQQILEAIKLLKENGFKIYKEF